MIESSASNYHAERAGVYTDLSGLGNLKALGRQDKEKALEEVAHQFESMMMQMMMKSMRQAGAEFSKDNPFKSSEGDMFQDMLDSQLSLSMGQGRGMGIAEAMIRQLRSSYLEQSEVAIGDQREFSVNDISRFDGLLSQVQQATNTADEVVNERPVAATDQTFSVQQSEAAPELREPMPQIDTPEEFVEHFLPMAEEAAEAMGVNPLVLLAQAALETGWGKHITRDRDGATSHNLFNIKADQRWQGDTVNVETLEFRGGVMNKERAEFRAYNSPKESFQDYVEFVSGSSRYQKAMECAGDPQQYVTELSRAGYATDPNYADKIMGVLQRIESRFAEPEQSQSNSLSGQVRL